MLNYLSFAQESSDKEPKYKNRIVLSQLNLINIYEPSLQLAFERDFHPKFSAQIETAYVLPRSIVGLSYYLLSELEANLKQYSGYRIKGELKYHFSKQMTYYRDKNSPVKSNYLAIEIFHHQTNCDCVDNIKGFDSTQIIYDEFNPNSGYYYDKYQVNRTISGVNFKFGVSKTSSNGLYLNFYTGLGVAYRNSLQTGRIYDNDKISDFLEFTQSNHFNRKGKGIVLTLPINFKLGISF